MVAWLLVLERSESYGWNGEGDYEAFAAARVARLERALDVAWERDELGARTLWTKRAESVLAAMKAKP